MRMAMSALTSKEEIHNHYKLCREPLALDTLT